MIDKDKKKIEYSITLFDPELYDEITKKVISWLQKNADLTSTVPIDNQYIFQKNDKMYRYSSSINMEGRIQWGPLVIRKGEPESYSVRLVFTGSKVTSDLDDILTKYDFSKSEEPVIYYF